MHRALMRPVAVGMQEANGDRLDPRLGQFGDLAADLVWIERTQHHAVAAHPPYRRRPSPGSGMRVRVGGGHAGQTFSILIEVYPRCALARVRAHVLARGTTLSTELLIFGNANGGTPFMQSNQTVGIDLPLKALVWQDAASKTWLSYNDPSWLAKRHDLAEVDPAITAMAAGVSAIAREATGSS
jgi:Domain of unknown function DUF302